MDWREICVVAAQSDVASYFNAACETGDEDQDRNCSLSQLCQTHCATNLVLDFQSYSQTT